MKQRIGKVTSLMPRLAMVVPTVVSLTEMPIINPRVKRELTSGWPNSVVLQNSKSMCSGCGLSVMLENNMLSISVTVRLQRVGNQRARFEFLKIHTAHCSPHPLGFIDAAFETDAQVPDAEESRSSTAGRGHQGHLR
jgi:hypothetical protein